MSLELWLLLILLILRLINNHLRINEIEKLIENQFMELIDKQNKINKEFLKFMNAQLTIDKFSGKQEEVENE